MISAGIDYQGWAQVAVAVAALVVAPPAIGSIYFKYFYTLRTTLSPVNPKEAGTSHLWDVELRNRSRLFGGFTVFLFPAGNGNSVVRFQQTSPNDGGMVVNPEIVEGALEIRVLRFARRRLLKLRVQFGFPDFPSFDAGKIRVARKTRSVKLSASTRAQVSLALVYQRLMLTMLVFAGVFGLIAFTIFHGYLTNG